MTVLRWRQRFEIEAALRLDSALSIGAADATGAIDHLVARDGADRPVVPGTSLAGVLRTLIEPHLEGIEISYWFGGTDGDDAASRVSVEDSLIEGAVLELRDGVGIDRITGAAAPSIKYNREVLAAGATFTIRIGIETETADEPVVLGLLVAALRAGVQLGAATSRGQGVARLLDGTDVAIARKDLGSFESTLLALGGGEAIAVDVPPLAASTLRLSLPWKPLGSLMVRSGVAGNAVDDLPLTSAQGEGRTTVLLPGSSIKGALRAHAEWIVRTVVGLPASVTDAGLGDSFNAQIAVPLVSALFGRPAAAHEDGRRPLPQGRAVVSVSDCRPLDPSSRQIRTIDAGAWHTIASSRRRPTNDPEPPTRDLTDAIEAAGVTTSELTPMAHVAIDRWTGAPSDAALFSTLEVRLGTWEPIRVTIDLARLARRLPHLGERRAAVMLMLLVLRDLADGRVPLGYGVNRGHGSISADVTDLQAEASVASLDELVGGLEPLSPEGIALLEQAWQSWITTVRRTSLET